MALALLLPALALATGCYAFDEIDQGRAYMKKHGAGLRPDRVAAPAHEAEPSDDEAEEDASPGLLARAKAFWDEHTQPGPVERPEDDGIVRCDLVGATTFTYESDCLSRGGRPVRS